VIIAYAATQEQGRDHFEFSSENPHVILGLVTIVILVLQIACEIVIGKQIQSDLLLSQHPSMSQHSSRHSTSEFNPDQPNNCNTNPQLSEDIIFGGGFLQDQFLPSIRVSLLLVAGFAIYTGLDNYSDEYIADENIPTEFIVFVCAWVVLYAGVSVYFACAGSSADINFEFDDTHVLDDNLYTGVVESGSAKSSETKESQKSDTDSIILKKVVTE